MNGEGGGGAPGKGGTPIFWAGWLKARVKLCINGAFYFIDK